MGAPQVALLLVLALASLLAAPGPAASQPDARTDRIQVVATSADLKALVEAVGGARVQVESLAAPDHDPHAIEVKPAQLARLQRAALLVRIGLDHEPWLSRIRAGERIEVLDVSRNVRLLQTQTPRLRAERSAHVHAYGNTHYWLDPQNARPITASILDALVKLSPENRAFFAANRRNFLALLDKKIEYWKEQLEPLHQAKVVVVHDTWSYFAERFGLDIVAAAEATPGVPPSPAELAALFKRMREAGVRLLIADPHSDPALVRQIAERTGARAVTLLPSGNDYVGLFDENVRRLSNALKEK